MKEFWKLNDKWVKRKKPSLYSKTEQGKGAVSRAVANYYRKKRLYLINILGGKCMCNGDNCWHNGVCLIADLRVLQLDHIKGDGADDRKQFGGSRWLTIYTKNIELARQHLQVLCANCNWAKRAKNHEYTQKYYKQEYDPLAVESCCQRHDAHYIALPAKR